MKVRLRLTALAFAVGLACAVQAGGAQAADLLGVVEDTLDHDATLAAARDAYRAAQQAVPKARAGLLPHVAGGWGRGYNNIVMEGFPNDHYWQSGWTVGLTQPLFDWALWSTWRQADYVVARGKLEAASAGQDAILRAAQAYFDALAAADETARATDYLRALDAHLALLTRAKAAGEATLVDLREAEASRAQAQLQLLDARDKMRLARDALERLTGKPAQTLATLPETAAMPALEPPDPEAWVTQAQAHGYPVQIHELALQIAKLDTEKARAGHYPSVDLQVTRTPAGAAGGYSRPTTTTTAMLAVTVPLFSGGETMAEVKEASALEDKARDELEAATRDAAGDTHDDWLRVTSGQAQIAAMDTLVQRTQASLQATKIGFGAGSRASTDVLRATDSFYASRRNLIRARYDAVLALLKWLADTASLNLDEVGHINAQLYAQRAGEGRMGDATQAAVVSSMDGVAPRVVGDKRIAVRTVSPAAFEADGGLRAEASATGTAQKVRQVRVAAPDAGPKPAPVATPPVLSPVPATSTYSPAPVAAPVPIETHMVVATPAPASSVRHPTSAAEMAPAIPAGLPIMGMPLS